MRTIRYFLATLCLLMGALTSSAADYTTYLTSARGFTEVTSTDAILADANYYYILVPAETNELIVGVGTYEAKPGWASEESKALRYKSAETDPMLDLTNFFTIEKSGSYIGFRNVVYNSDLFQTHDNAGYMYVLSYSDPTLDEWSYLTPTYQNGYWLFESGKYPISEGNWASGYLGPWNNTVAEGEAMALNRKNVADDEAGHYRLFRIAKADLLLYATVLTPANGFTEVTTTEGLSDDPSQCYLITSADEPSLFVGVGRYEKKPDWASEDTKALRYRQAGDPVADLSNFFTIEKEGDYIGLRNVYYNSSLFQTHDGAGFMYVLTYTEPTMSEWTYLIPTYQNGYWMFENGMYPHTDEEAQWKGYMGPWTPGHFVADEPIALNRLNITDDEAGHYRLWRIARTDLFMLMQNINSSNTADVTWKITNPSFETGDMTGWSFVAYDDHNQVIENYNDVQISSSYTMSNKSGTYLFNAFQWWCTSMIISQTIPNLPSGEYELSGVVATWENRTVTFTGNENTITTDGQGADTGIRVSMPVTIGKEGNLVITAGSTAQWWNSGHDGETQTFFKLDDVQLHCKQLYLDGMSVRLPNNETTLLAPNQWYYYDVTYGTEYLLIGPLDGMVYSTDGNKTMANVSTAAPTRTITLSEGRIYFKTTRNDATLYITPSRSVSEGTFTAVALNVDGLPNKILTYNLNPDGPGESGTAKISQYLASKNYDMIGCSEDFNYNGTLMSQLNDNYSCGTIRRTLSIGGVLGGWPIDTDGLNLIWKNAKINAQNESWTRWNTTSSTDGNQYVRKGFRHYDVTIDGSALIDVYILHMDAGDNSDAIDSRHAQWRQLRDAINTSNLSRPKLVIGDTNSRWTREEIATNFMVGLSEQLTVSDVWVEKYRNNVYPTTAMGDLTDASDPENYTNYEIVDKIFYINPTAANTVQLQPLSFKIEHDYTYDSVDHDGNTNPLGDHHPVVVEFKWTKSGEALNRPVTLADAADNTKTIRDYSGLEADITLQGRTLYKGMWNTLCLPFEVTDSNTDDGITFTSTLLEGATVMKLDTENTYEGHKTGIEGNTLYLYFKDASSIVAGTPYIVKLANGSDDLVNPVFQGVTISTTPAGSITSEDDNVIMKGIFSPYAVNGENRKLLYLGEGNTLHYPSGAMNINAFRAYFELSEQMSEQGTLSRIVMNIDDDATGIATINHAPSTENQYYDLQGRKVNLKPSKGVYIVNGRKVIVR